MQTDGQDSGPLISASYGGGLTPWISAPSVCKCCWSFEMLRYGSEPRILEYSIQALESGSSHDFTDHI